jgi:hypothetical protein
VGEQGLEKEKRKGWLGSVGGRLPEKSLGGVMQEKEIYVHVHFIVTTNFNPENGGSAVVRNLGINHHTTQHSPGNHEFCLQHRENLTTRKTLKNLHEPVV